MTVSLSQEDLRSWFLSKDLSWTPSIEKTLDDLGVDSVQDIKMMKLDEWKSMFADEKPIKQRNAEKVYEELCQEIVVSAIAVVAATAISMDFQTEPTPSAPMAEIIEERFTQPVPSTSAPVANSRNIRANGTKERSANPTTRGDESRKTDEDLCCECCNACLLCLQCCTLCLQCLSV